MTIKSKKLSNSAKGQECCLAIPGVCNHDPATTVLAHMQFEGGIMGGKASDMSAAFACSDCHRAVDQREIKPSERYFYMARGMVRTQQIWIDMGLVVVPQDADKADRIARKHAGIKPKSKFANARGGKLKTRLTSNGARTEQRKGN